MAFIKITIITVITYALQILSNKFFCCNFLLTHCTFSHKSFENHTLKTLNHLKKQFCPEESNVVARKGNSGGSWLPETKKANMLHRWGNSGGSWPPAFPPARPTHIGIKRKNKHDQNSTFFFPLHSTGVSNIVLVHVQ